MAKEHDRKDRTAWTRQLGLDSHPRRVVTGLPVQISLKVNIDDNTKRKGKIITPPFNKIYVTIQPDDNTKMFKTDSFITQPGDNVYMII
jgi:hypothetical protein